jgi:hypothetical protein
VCGYEDCVWDDDRLDRRVGADFSVVWKILLEKLGSMVAWLDYI